MTKEEKIKEAYGEYWEEMKPWINENGWFDKNAFYNKNFFFKYDDLKLFFSHKEDFMIPISLKGIENNNCWIKIESENDLPKENLDCNIVFSDGEIRCDRFLINYKNFITSHYKNITHYQPIVKPQPPIY